MNVTKQMVIWHGLHFSCSREGNVVGCYKCVDFDVAEEIRLSRTLVHVAKCLEKLEISKNVSATEI